MDYTNFGKKYNSKNNSVFDHGKWRLNPEKKFPGWTKKTRRNEWMDQVFEHSGGNNCKWKTFVTHVIKKKTSHKTPAKLKSLLS